MTKTAATTTAIVGLAALTAACATVKVVGRDIQSVGQAGSDAINH